MFLFLRLAPVAPNVFLNAAAGIVGVPFNTFFLASLIGQIPFSFLYIKTGMMLDQVTSIGGFDTQVSDNAKFLSTDASIVDSGHAVRSRLHRLAANFVDKEGG